MRQTRVAQPTAYSKENLYVTEIMEQLKGLGSGMQLEYSDDIVHRILAAFATGLR